ncbi:phosphatidylglycerophosphatase A [Pararobbsia alpina]|uniref:phosphatidylglycerophosphatase A family protein n=1 Tax=Pararobbsia alpina TaxID=621374 RepID=UPI0039A60873
MTDPHDIIDADPERKAERNAQRDAQLRRRFGGRFGYFRNRKGSATDGGPGPGPTGDGGPSNLGPQAPSGGKNRGARPTAEFMRSHPAHLLSLGFGTGLSRFVPGTVGTVFGWVSFLVLNPYLTSAGWIALIVLGFFVGIWATDFTARRLGAADPGAVNWDEIVAFWLVMLFVTPATFAGQLFAFVVFRLFDMIKPPPIRWFDRTFKGGLGIMIDDIVAAFMTLLVIALVRTYYGH